MAWTAAASARGAEAMHKKYGKGHLSARMLAADRANLAKGRAKRATERHGSKRFKLRRKPEKPVSRGNAAALKVIHNDYFTLRIKAPLGVRRMTRHQKVTLKTNRITGVNPKFVKRLAPSGFDTRTKWGHSHRTKMKRVLKPRESRGVHLKNFRYRRHLLMPK